MAQTASKKWLGIGLVVVVAIIALLIWNKQRQNHSSELVIGISPLLHIHYKSLRMKPNSKV
jgi:D-methionine transport system substrate-binding protein